VGSGEGLRHPQLGSGGLPPEKKALKLCISEQVLVLLSYITSESGGLSPSPESGGDLSPVPPPCSDAYGQRETEMETDIERESDRHRKRH